RDRNVTGVQTCALPISGQELLALQANLSAPIAFSADGRVIAATILKTPSPGALGPEEGEAIGLWELATAKELLRLDTGPVGPIRSEERRVGKECRGRCG